MSKYIKLVARGLLSRLNRLHICFKALLILLIGMTVFVASLYWLDVSYQWNLRQCYDAQRMYNSEANIKWLDDILKASRQPRPGHTIFFHVSTCLDEVVELNARQACAIESAAKINPDMDIFVLFASPVGMAVDVSASIEALFAFANIHWRNVDLWAYGRDTPAEEWIHDRSQLFRSSHFIAHSSEYMRYVRYGGTHADLDVIMKKSISDLQPNFAGAESDKDVAVAVLNFDHTGNGHMLAEYNLREFVRSFDGTSLSLNGSGVITRILRLICDTENTAEMTRERCQHFEVMPQSAFDAVGFANWSKLFEPVHASEVSLLTKDSISVNFWNTLSQNRRLRIGSGNTVYELMAQEFCPLVYESCDVYF